MKEMIDKVAKIENPFEVTDDGEFAPDFILAEFICKCLSAALEEAIAVRERG